MKVMIVVTHLLGTGHLTRALTLAQAFQSAGHEPIVVSGGIPVQRLEGSGIPIKQLPAVRSDGVNFSHLLDGAGTEVSIDFLAQRTTDLVNFLQQYQPDVLITELFPFGRRILRDEFTALLNAAKEMPGKPLICASIRDILAPPSKPKKVQFAEDMVVEFYDAFLVHSDPTVTPLDLSWPVSDALRPKLKYTGFVAPPPALPHPEHDGEGEVIVSAGGGDVGDALFLCARNAANLDRGRTWRILVGGNSANARIAKLQQNAPANLIVEPTRPDFRQMLYHAAASVSFCGYNTALDLLQSGCAAVLVPFDEGNEVEQNIRATALARQPAFAILRSAEMSPEKLLSCLEAAEQNAPQRKKHTQAYGAETTVTLIEKMIGQRHAH